MRKTDYEFIYDNGDKKLRYGDMSWEQYTRYFYNPDGIIDEVISEFQELPEMNQEDKNLVGIDIIRNVIGRDLPKNIKEEKEPRIPEFHIPMGYLMHHMNQQYSEIMKMPARLVFLFNSDMDIFAGGKAYDPNRNSTTADREGFKDLLGTTKV